MSTQRVVLLLVVVAAVIGLVTWFFSLGRRDPRGLPVQPSGTAAPEALVQKKNEGVAQLENGDYASCDPIFVELSDQLPDEPLGPRNLLIARLLTLEQIDRQRQPSEFQSAIEQLEQAVELLQSRESENALAAVLIGRAAAAAGDLPRARAAFDRATTQAPQDPSLWFERFDLDRNADDPSHRKEARAALGEAHRLDPDNLFLLIEWLLVQADLRDPEIANSLTSARAALEPLAATVQKQSRVDVRKLLEDATAAADSANANALLRHVRVLANVIRPDEAAQSDRRRVARHPLEFALQDFRDEFYAAHSSHVPAGSGPFGVRFEYGPAESQPSAIENTRAIQSADFDLDGKWDILLLRDRSIEIWSQRRDAERWELLTRAETTPGMRGLIPCDLDGDADHPARTAPPGAANREEPADVPGGPTDRSDADLDLVLFGEQGLLVFENVLDPVSGGRTLAPTAQSDGFVALRQVLAVAAADLDHDGDLDLAVSSAGGISLWSNRGDRTFENITSQLQAPPTTLEATAIIPIDWDRDVDIDLLLAGRGKPFGGLLENVRHGRFRFAPIGNALDDFPASALVPLDIDGNVAWDYVIAGAQGALLQRTKRPVAGVVEFLPADSIAEWEFSGLTAGDVDNDGFLDLVGWSNERVTLLRGLPEARFESIAGVLPEIKGPIRGAALADVDADGDLDLWVATGSAVTWFRNDGGNRHHWIDVALKGAQVKGDQRSASGRVNHYGVGSLLELKAGLSYQARVVAEQRTHFGLGNRDRADVLRVLWTNGVPHDVLGPQADQLIFEQQTLKGSCPYLYTWTGSRFEFWTDLLWAAPIGLQFADGVIAPARGWEYLKIAGDRLQPVAGRYRLRITEELWEAAYFDRVKLLAVDHPAEVEIFSNEKVGPAELAEFRVHTLRQRRIPVAARDQEGRDVLPQVVAEDGQFLKGYERKLRQGLTTGQTLELDLGRLEAPKRIVLFLTGWVFPTDTSLNVGLSHDPRIPPLKPPALLVPVAAGEWREVLPAMGFPGGKTKTIAVDLTGLFPTDDYRVRIVTNMELYWDAAFFSVDEEPVPHALHEAPLVSAQLRYRGFSRRIADPAHGPEFFDYAEVSTAPRWPPLDGRYTRYGDVTELLAAEDDRLAVLGAGDEIALEFDAPKEPLPAGWKRDFLLYNVGWDKDADLNTVYGQSVEPFPFRGMGRYPFPEGIEEPDGRAHRAWLDQFQTREPGQQRFWQGIRRFDARSVPDGSR